MTAPDAPAPFAASDSPPAGAALRPVVRWRAGRRSALDDALTEEVPVALEFNGISHAVMLASPTDLEDFALGFALAEGLIDDAAELYGCETVESTLLMPGSAGAAAPPQRGLTVRMEISARRFAGLKERRRTLAGRTGCGICGTESLDQVLRPVDRVPAGMTFGAQAIAAAMRAMSPQQTLNRATGAVHAAAYCAADGRVELLREDVGRHNALDKLVGAMARAGVDPATGFVAVSSRASVEMVQKACQAGVPLLAAVSAPTTLAVDTASQAGLTLVGLVRGDDLVVYTQPARVALPADEGGSSGDPGR